MKKLLLFAALLLAQSFPLFLRGADTLTVQRIRELAVQNSPLQQKKLLAESIAALQIRNLRSNDLPRIGFGAQATWQSDVFGFPAENPALPIPQVPKDQYKLTLDVSQRLWDGGSDRFARQQRQLESQLAAVQVDADVFQVREVVTDLFFKILLLQESERILEATRADLQNRLRQAQAAVAEGAALRTTADQLQIQIWKTDQQLDGVRADRQALLAVLGAWIGVEPPAFALRAPTDATRPGAGIEPANEQLKIVRQRPEYALIGAQQRLLVLQSDALRLRRQPRVEAFAQGGLGRPNPFNFFETGFEPFALVGLRAVWTPVDWGNVGREREITARQLNMLNAQTEALDQRFDALLRRDWGEISKAEAQMRQDDEIIKLQEDIVRRAEAQVQNGVMTTTEYLTQLNLLTQARLTRATHEIQVWQARETVKVRTGEN